MRNYLAAECYKVFHRKYFYLTLLVVLALEGVLLWGYSLTLNWGNPNVDFNFAAGILATLLVVGLYAPVLTGDMVFSEQYKNGTLKNEVCYGAPRLRVYLGKLLTAGLVSVLAAVAMLGAYIGGSALLFPANDQGWSLIACLLAGAPALWLAALGVTMAVYFLVRSTNVAAFLTVGILGVLPPILQGLGILIHPVFEVVRQFTPAVVLDNLSAMAAAGRWDYVAQCWIVGLAWLIGATLIGLLSFRKMEIK